MSSRRPGPSGLRTQLSVGLSLRLTVGRRGAATVVVLRIPARIMPVGIGELHGIAVDVRVGVRCRVLGRGNEDITKDRITR
jgi:hypothetical protein